MNLEGKSFVNGNSFLLNGKKFYIKERKKDLEKKPKYYLAMIEGKTFEYISSLFFTGQEGIYKLDYNKQEYELKNINNNITIKKL